MKVATLVEALERAAKTGSCESGMPFAAGWVQREALAGDKMAKRAYAALALLAGRPDWVGSDGRPVVSKK